MLKRFTALFLTIGTLSSAAVAQTPSSPSPSPQPSSSPRPSPSPAGSPSPSPRPASQDAPISQYAAFASNGGKTTMEDIALACKITDPKRNQSFSYSSVVDGVFHSGTVKVTSKECGTGATSARVIRGQFSDISSDSSKGCTGNITIRVSNSDNDVLATWNVTSPNQNRQCPNNGKTVNVNLRRTPWTATDTCRRIAVRSGGQANLRWTPDGPVRDRFNNGSQVVEYGRSGGWSFISNRGIQGYIDSSLLEACPR